MVSDGPSLNMIKKILNSIIDRFYQKPLFGFFFRTLVYSLKSELGDCESVLDLGCGPRSSLEHVKNVKYSVGVEYFDKYYQETLKRKIHNKYIKSKIQEIDFPPKSFDAVILIEVLEHLKKEEGKKILAKMEKWARKKVIVSVPNGFLVQSGVDGNPLQEHISGWVAQEFKKRGYRVTGRAGLKYLRMEKKTEGIYGGDIYRTMRWRPRIFWFLISSASQPLVYFIPNLAYGLFCVKKISR